MLDPYEIRKDFPIFDRIIDDRKIVYFDNAATSQKPRQVIDTMKKFYEQYNANIHRGLHRLSQEASELYEEAHDVIAEFIGARDRSEIVFVRNTTEALNIVSFAWGLNNLREGDEIVISIMEHHSNFLPWFKIAEYTGAKVRVVDIHDNATLNYRQLESMINGKTRVISIVHMSNVSGVINDIKRIAKLAREVNALLVVDGAQSVPHMSIDVKDLDIDFLAFSGHKMLGATGIGVLYVSKHIVDELDTFMVGGDTIKEVHYRGDLEIVWHDLPWRFEAGTPNIAGGIGLAEAAKYLMKIGMENVRRHEVSLIKYLFKRLDEEGLLEKSRIIGSKDPESRGGLISFTLGDLDPHATAMMLDVEGIAVRSGFHCAQPLHERLGFKRGSVRASFYIYNTFEEIDYFIDVLKKMVLKPRL